MTETLELKALSRIYGKGRGWAFSKKDFLITGSSDSLDKTLSRLAKKGKIRHLARGLYDYPRYSKWLEQTLEPDYDQVAHAIARKFGWNIQITGNSALNIMGLSTQIPTQYTYLSDGSSKSYEILNRTITFKKTPLTQLSTKLKQSALLVQSIQTLGQNELTDQQQDIIIKYLSAGQQTPTAKLAKQILKDTQFVTTWIQQHIFKLLNEYAQKSIQIEIETTKSMTPTKASGKES
ncbi:MAG: type IV toxin-antitoxin system AbiEi family antitoxin domain-containing protein [Saccharospirillaceae bacterium]|nr:type IV toxin-antitoxin system AbiEi family antitoxin domain-containing protein [Saccharospirillaceae bacterium]